VDLIPICDRDTNTKGYSHFRLPTERETIVVHVMHMGHVSQISNSLKYRNLICSAGIWICSALKSKGYTRAEYSLWTGYKCHSKYRDSLLLCDIRGVYIGVYIHR
jgi:hypothetical protein